MSALTPGAGVASRAAWHDAGCRTPKVLPVPVLAWPMMSWPGRPSGMVCSWMGKASTMPFAAERLDDVLINAEFGERSHSE